MRKLIFLILLSFISLAIYAQSSAGFSTTMTVNKDFGPAVITLTSGKTIVHKQSNISMTNGRLLYKKGKLTMQANMDNIKSVDFAGQSYLRVDTALAQVVDSVQGNLLLRVTLIDIEAYRNQMINSSQVTSLDIGTAVNITTIDPTESQYPVVNYYYYAVGGQIVKVHERNIRKALPKEKHRMLKSIIQSDGFDWKSEPNLIAILQLFS